MKIKFYNIISSDLMVENRLNYSTPDWINKANNYISGIYYIISTYSIHYTHKSNIVDTRKTFITNRKGNK